MSPSCCWVPSVPAAVALAAGLIDELVDGDLLSAAVSCARGFIGRKQRLRDRPVPVVQGAEVAEATAAALKAGKRRPAVQAAIDAITATAHLGIDEGLAEERAVFQKLRVSREAFALRHQFFAERDSGKHPSLDGATPRTVKLVAVIGAGTMGSGIAIAALDAGYRVCLLEQDAAALESGAARIHAHYASRVKAGKLNVSGAATAEAQLQTSLN